MSENIVEQALGAYENASDEIRAIVDELMSDEPIAPLVENERTETPSHE